MVSNQSDCFYFAIDYVCQHLSKYCNALFLSSLLYIIAELVSNDWLKIHLPTFHSLYHDYLMLQCLISSYSVIVIVVARDQGRLFFMVKIHYYMDNTYDSSSAQI